MALAIWPYTSREFHIYANKQSLILFTGMLWEVKCITLHTFMASLANIRFKFCSCQEKKKNQNNFPVPKLVFGFHLSRSQSCPNNDEAIVVISRSEPFFIHGLSLQHMH